MLKTKCYENIIAISDKAREAGIPVFHNYFVLEKGEKGIIVRGAWKVAPVDGVKPKEGDFVLERARMSSFNETQLDILLR